MKQPTKIENCLYAFLEAGPAGLRQVEIASPHQGYLFKQQPGLFWSSCLNTDVSRLGKQGIEIARALDPFTRQDGGQANFNRYWLPTRAAAQQTLNLLNHYRLKRGADRLPVNLAQLLLEQFPTEAEQAKAVNRVSSL